MDRIVVLDFGGQYCNLISRRIRDFGVYSEVLPANTVIEKLLQTSNIKGVILSGGAVSVYGKRAPKCSKEIFSLDLPILGICYGHQLIAHLDKGRVIGGKAGEYGQTDMRVSGRTVGILAGLNRKESVWMNHKDVVKSLPKGYTVVASTDSSPVAAFENNARKVFGVQFHPEVTHTKNGNRILKNFVFGTCRARKGWNMASVLGQITDEAKRIIGKRKAIIGLSGGVDSSTAATLLGKVIGKNLTAVYVDTGLMRERETDTIKRAFSKMNLNLEIVHAQDRFFRKLKGVTVPERKRKIIGKLFIDIFQEAGQKQKADVLIQGTIYSDRIESGITQHSSKIKSHHNVGGLPKKMKLQVYEPLRNLYKDEVRRLAKEVGLSDKIIKQHVFPGPGLAIRIIGDVTPEKVAVVRKAGTIVEQELKRANMYHKVWMGFAVLLPIKSVGIQGDARTYKYPVAVRIIQSKDAMTANFARMPYKILEEISTRITNEIAEVNRVVYDVSNKPPATMEWE